MHEHRAAGAKRRARARARADRAEGRGAGGDGARRSARAGRRSSPPMPRTSPRPRPRARPRPSSTGCALDDKRVAAMADGLDVVRALADPVGTVTERWTRPNGMTHRARARAARRRSASSTRAGPNVTADAGALCLKAGNAAILRGGSESHRSTRAIHAALVEGLTARRPAGGRDRSWCRRATAPPSGMMLAGLDGSHRRDRAARRQEPGRARAGGGARAGVRASRRHLPRLCRQGRRRSTWRKTIVLNAKMRRTGVCGAAETLLVDRAVAPTHLKPLVAHAARRRLRGARRRRAVQTADARVKPASEADWSTEYLDAIIAAKVVDGVDAAIDAYRALRLAPHRRDRHRGPGGGGEIPARGRFRRSCCTTPRRSSPTAASSASAPRSASPPAACTRAARSASSSSPASSTACAASGQIRP